MIEINNLATNSVDGNFIKKICRKVLKGEKKNKTELSIVFLSKDRIKKLNKEYRKKNLPTDVLSFLYNKKEGEIAICPEEVRKNARRYGTAFKKELTRVLIHGLLHLSGYDHEKSRKEAQVMEKKEKYYLEKIYVQN
ncbi:MAG: rRNA maturation RNase YbeY [Candidatus Pacebacteria bacterium]|nr:rRNA maturation RNase YbeY [Candidatus Paceibacterota bacterium]